MASVSAGHIILTPTQTVGSGRPLRESNPGPPHQESRALPTELPPPPPPPPLPLNILGDILILQNSMVIITYCVDQFLAPVVTFRRFSMDDWFMRSRGPCFTRSRFCWATFNTGIFIVAILSFIVVADGSDQTSGAAALTDAAVTATVVRTMVAFATAVELTFLRLGGLSAK